MTTQLMIIFAAIMATYYLAEIAGKGRRGRAAIDARYGEGWKRDLLHLLLAIALLAVATSISGHLYLSVSGHSVATATATCS